MAVKTTIELNTREWSVIQCLVYYCIFNHPLTLNEIFQFSRFEDICSLLCFLREMTDKKMVQKEGKYYHLNELGIDPVHQRANGKRIYQEKLPKALKMAKRIWKFPFTRGVYFSGSASKINMNPTDDIDFFIITAKGRLWLCRAILTIYKKIWLLNSRKYFCINYYVSEAALKIREENQFTAMEMVTLQPVITRPYIHQTFLALNQWPYRFYPNSEVRSNLLPQPGYYPVKVWIEILFDGNTGDRLDSLFQKIFSQLIKLKYKRRLQWRYHKSFTLTQHVSKHHPKDYQGWILKQLNQKLRLFCDKFHVQKPGL